jgi:Mg2+ and Co2+ transporter CorA
MSTYTITKISSLLERQTGHNLDRQMSALNSLEQEAKDENQIMQKLAVKSSQDSDSIRILTIITLIYLPCTVVSVSDISHAFQ